MHLKLLTPVIELVIIETERINEGHGIRAERLEDLPPLQLQVASCKPQSFRGLRERRSRQRGEHSGITQRLGKCPREVPCRSHLHVCHLCLCLRQKAVGHEVAHVCVHYVEALQGHFNDT